MSVSPGRPGCCRCGPLFWLLHPHHLGGRWQEELCGFGRAGTATLSSLMRSPTDERTHEDTAGTAGFPIKPSRRLSTDGSTVPSDGWAPLCSLRARAALSCAPTHRSWTRGNIPAKQADDSHLSFRAPILFFCFPPTHDTGISHHCPSRYALPSTTDNAKEQGQAPYVTPGYPSSAKRFPSPFLAAELQFRVICVSSAKQTFVLQTELAEPALDLYFSVCIWTPSPCRWKLMSSLSPGIQSERRNCTAIWSSSAQCSHRKLSLQLRIKL